MALHDRAIQWVTGRFEGVDPTYRREVAATARESAADAGAAARLAEVASLAGLALRLRARHRTGDRAGEIWRQGACLGAELLLVALVLEGRSGAVYGALGLLCALLGRRLCAAALVAAGALFSTAPLAVCAVAAGGLAAGAWGRGRGRALATAAAWRRVRVRGGPLTGGAAPYGRALAAGVAPLRWPLTAAGAALLTLPALLVLLVLLAPESASAVAAVGVTGILPGALIALGGFDARLAVAGGVTWLSRLVVADLAALSDALTAAEGRQVLIVRWLLMASGVAVAWCVARGSIRRLGRL